MSFSLPDLPYETNALEPFISAQTLEFHHGKHHAAYVNKANELIEGSEYEGQSLEEVIKATHGSNPGLFNQVAQIWNHTFYWHSMKPDGGGKPGGDLADAINQSFGSYDEFAQEFKNAGATQFGSGWAWLVKHGNALEMRKTLNANTPVTENNVTPLLTMDVWEHAYYIDYQNRRPDYMNAFLTNLVNWDFAAQNFAS